MLSLNLEAFYLFKRQTCPSEKNQSSARENEPFSCPDSFRKKKNRAIHHTGYDPMGEQGSQNREAYLPKPTGSNPPPVG